MSKKDLESINIIKSTAYKKFDIIMENISSILIKEWTIMHSLAYICVKYKDKFGKDFILSYNGAPSKCYEYKLTSRIWSMLNAKACEGEKVKNYIDWFYDNYNGKLPFRSIGALAKAETIMKYLADIEKSKTITLTTKLPDNIIEICKKYNDISYVTTYGELIFIKQSIDQNSNVSYASIINDLNNIEFILPKI